MLMLSNFVIVNNVHFSTTTNKEYIIIIKFCSRPKNQMIKNVTCQINKIERKQTTKACRKRVTNPRK